MTYTLEWLASKVGYVGALWTEWTEHLRIGVILKLSFHTEVHIAQDIIMLGSPRLYVATTTFC